MKRAAAPPPPAAPVPAKRPRFVSAPISTEVLPLNHFAESGKNSNFSSAKGAARPVKLGSARVSAVRASIAASSPAAVAASSPSSSSSSSSSPGSAPIVSKKAVLVDVGDRNKNNAAKIEKRAARTLPGEVWRRVFSHLSGPRAVPTLRLVCREWRELLKDFSGHPFAAVSFEGVGRVPEARDLRDLCCSGTALTELVLTGLSRSVAVDPLLQALALSGPAVTGRLRVLGLSRTAVTDEGLRAVGRALPGLTEVRLADCVNATGQGIDLVLAGCRDLEVLDLSGCFGSWSRPITSTSMGQLLTQCPRMRVLGLSRCDGLGVAGAILVLRLALRELDLSYCTGLHFPRDGGSHLQELAQIRNPTLTRLNLANCSRLDAQDVQLIADLAPGLEDLDLSHCASEPDAARRGFDIDGVLPRLRRLRRLGLAGLRIPPGAFPGNLAACCPMIEALDVNSSRFVTDEALAALVGARPAPPPLRELDLSYCWNLTPALFRRLGAVRTLRRLSVVGWRFTLVDDLALASMFGRDAAAAAAPGFAGIEAVDFSALPSVTGACFAAPGCKSLREVVMVSCPLLTDTGIDMLATLPNLETLHIQHCQRLTDRSIDHLLRGARSLKSLKIQGTNFSLAKVREFELQRPGVCRDGPKPPPKTALVLQKTASKRSLHF
jgi:hypothetical protein